MDLNILFKNNKPISLRNNGRRSTNFQEIHRFCSIKFGYSIKHSFKIKPINHMGRYVHDDFRTLADMNNEFISSFTNLKSDHLLNKFLRIQKFKGV